MNGQEILTIVIFVVLLIVLKFKKHQNKMVVNKKKNNNRRKQLDLRVQQEKELSEELTEIVDKVSKGKDNLKAKKFELARKLNQTREEIKTLKDRIV